MGRGRTGCKSSIHPWLMMALGQNVKNVSATSSLWYHEGQRLANVQGYRY